MTNTSAHPVPLPPGTEILHASHPLEQGQLPADTTVWLRVVDEVPSDR
ncbi:hypothetical protein [Streptomyces sp. URMC 129]